MNDDLQFIKPHLWNKILDWISEKIEKRDLLLKCEKAQTNIDVMRNPLRTTIVSYFEKERKEKKEKGEC